MVDVGGDDRGALALGRFADGIKAEGDYDLLLVVNMYRPETRDIESAIQILQEIEFSGKIKFTGIVNNSNLGVETTPEDVVKSNMYAQELSKISKLLQIFESSTPKHPHRDVFSLRMTHRDGLLPLDILLKSC